MIWLKLVMVVILTEAIVEISVGSVLFERFRAWAGGVEGSLRHVFVTCGYCQSVWMAVGLSYAFGLQVIGWGWPETLAWGFVLHRAANVWHEFLSRWFGRVPLRIHIHGLNDGRTTSGNEQVDLAVGGAAPSGPAEDTTDRENPERGVPALHYNAGAAGSGGQAVQGAVENK